MTTPLRIGIIGLGMGQWHIQNYQKDPRVCVTAICDTNSDRLKEVGDKYGISGRYTEAGAMFHAEKLDAVSVATPNRFHAPLTIDALRAGLHVLCEKPMAMTIAEAEAMQKEAVKAQKNLMINFTYRFMDMSFALKEQVTAGVVGDIYHGHTVWHRRRGIPGFGGWFCDRSLAGGGPLIDLGVHRIDLALWLMGYPDPIAVSGATHNVIATQLAQREGKAYTVEDAACGMVKFSNGASLLVEASWALNIKDPEYMVTTLCGTRGGLTQKNINGGYAFTAEIYTEEGSNLYTKTLDRSLKPAPSATSEFISSVIERRPPMATAEEGIKVMKILEGIYTSAATGREFRFDANR